MLGPYHPIIVHFPVAILTVAPLFLLLSLLIKTHSRTFLISALILFLIGTVSLLAATTSGESAAEAIAKNTIISDALHELNEHEEHAEQARNLYIGLTIVLVLFFFAEKRLPPKIAKAISIILVLCSFGQIAILLETAHHGGALVHKHHIHSNVFDQK